MIHIRIESEQEAINQINQLIGILNKKTAVQISFSKTEIITNIKYPKKTLKTNYGQVKMEDHCKGLGTSRNEMDKRVTETEKQNL